MEERSTNSTGACSIPPTQGSRRKCQINSMLTKLIISIYLFLFLFFWVGGCSITWCWKWLHFHWLKWNLGWNKWFRISLTQKCENRNRIMTQTLQHQRLQLQSQYSYSQLPLRWTHSGPAPTVRLREVSALEGDEVNDCSMAGTKSTLDRCPL